MKIEEQVLTIVQAKHLQELGLDMSDAAFVWNTNLYTKDTHLGTGYIDRKRSVYTYTLQELLSKFPPKYHDRVIAELTNGVTVTYGEILEISRCTGAEDEIFYGFHYGHNLFNGRTDRNPLQAAYKTLCWILEEKEGKK